MQGIEREVMKTTYTEADVNLPQQIVCALTTNECIKVLSVDIAMCVLMPYHYYT